MEWNPLDKKELPFIVEFNKTQWIVDRVSNAFDEIQWKYNVSISYLDLGIRKQTGRNAIFFYQWHCFPDQDKFLKVLKDHGYNAEDEKEAIALYIETIKTYGSRLI